VYALLPHRNLRTSLRVHPRTIGSIVAVVTSDSSLLQNGRSTLSRGATQARRPSTEQTCILERCTSIEDQTIQSTHLLSNRTIPRRTRYLGVLESGRITLVPTKSRPRSLPPTLGNAAPRRQRTQLLRLRSTRRLLV
jgi:hypothetical protein